MRRSVFLCAVFSAALCGAPVFAASPAIGVATALGAFSANNASVAGPVDVFDGMQLSTTISPSEVRLANGVDVRLATRSVGTIYGDRLILREGAVRMAGFDTYPVEAGDFQVKADGPGASAIVRVTAKTIEVASIGGTVQVTDGGAMLTHVAAGAKMSFQNTSSGGQSTNSGQTGATPAQQPPSGQTGAAPAERGPMSDKKAILWAAGVCAVGAIVVGSIAAAQGKSPF